MKIVHNAIVSCVLILALQLASTVNAEVANYTQNFTCNTSITGSIKSPIDITPITCSNIAVFNINFSPANASFVFNNTGWYNYLVRNIPKP
jgi:hypothetical protein